MLYHVNYFLSKFEKIPEKKWCISVPHNSLGQSCVLGHCGLSNIYEATEESKALVNVLPFSFFINDGCDDNYQQPTPKQRIIAALIDIKAKQAVEEVKLVLSKQRAGNMASTGPLI